MSCWTSPSTMKVGETWMPFWRAYLQCRFTSLSRSGNREGLGKFHPAIALDPPDDVVGRGIEVGPPAMTVEFEFLAMRGHRRHDGFRGSLSVFEGSQVELVAVLDLTT